MTAEKKKERCCNTNFWFALFLLAFFFTLQFLVTLPLFSCNPDTYKSFFFQCPSCCNLPPTSSNTDDTNNSYSSSNSSSTTSATAAAAATTTTTPCCCPSCPRPWRAPSPRTSRGRTTPSCRSETRTTWHSEQLAFK